MIPEVLNTQSWNEYTYVYNSPVNYSDPSGNAPLIEPDDEKLTIPQLNEKYSNSNSADSNTYKEPPVPGMRRTETPKPSSSGIEVESQKPNNSIAGKPSTSENGAAPSTESSPSSASDDSKVDLSRFSKNKEFDGVNFHFDQAQWASANTEKLIKDHGASVFASLARAAKSTGVTDVFVSTANYLPNQQPARSHAKKIAVDVAYIKGNNSAGKNVIQAFSNGGSYNQNTGKITHGDGRAEPELIGKFTDAFMDRKIGRGGAAWQPWRMLGVPSAMGRGNELRKGIYANRNLNITSGVAAKAMDKGISIHQDAVHSNHGHFMAGPSIPSAGNRWKDQF